MANPIKNFLVSHIAQALDKAFPGHHCEQAQIYESLGLPPQFKMGHYAFACFPLAKSLKMGPPQIAQQLAQAFPALDEISQARAIGPYLNLDLSTEFLAKNVLGDIHSGKTFKRELLEKTPKTMIEYSQPNTHKELHVGHMRNMSLGHSLVHILKYLNYEVVSSTYPGDVGTHVAKVLWYLKHRNTQERPSDPNALGSWIGNMYSVANKALNDETGTEKEDENRKILTEILAQLHAKSGEYFNLWQETREWSLKLMHNVYDFFGITFDQWYFESTVDEPSLKYVHDLYEKGILIKDDGAIGMDLSEDKLGFCMLVKSDGNGLYSTKDVELARLKFEEHKIENNIYVVDNRQSHHFKQVFKVLERIGFENAKKCFHLAYEMVELSDGAMSSREGNFVLADSLINNMQMKIINEYLDKYRGDWSDVEIAQTANFVARGAINYGMLSMDPNKKIIFDMDEWLRLDGESGPYIQYVYARIISMCKKNKYQTAIEVNYADLSHPIEMEILIKLNEFNQTVINAGLYYKPSSLCHYLYELSKLYNKFYAECPVNKAATETLRNARLSISAAVAIILKQGLGLLAIPTPEKM